MTDSSMIWTSTMKWYNTQTSQPASFAWKSFDDARFNPIAGPRDGVKQRYERQLHHSWSSKAFYNHYDVRQHSACETASTMQDSLKNQRNFKIFENFELFLKPDPVSFSGHRIFPDLVLSGSKDTYHSFSLTISQLNLTIGLQALAIFVSRNSK